MVHFIMISKKKLKQRLTTILSIDSHPAHIAAGFAVGVFISFIPPVPGLHTTLALAVAFIFRLNKITCVTGSMVNTYLTTIPTLIASYKLGAYVLGLPTEWSIETLSWESFKTVLIRDAKPLMLGCSIIGFIAATIAYFVIYRLVVSFRNRDAAMGELTREMEITGEDLEQIEVKTTTVPVVEKVQNDL